MNRQTEVEFDRISNYIKHGFKGGLHKNFKESRTFRKGGISQTSGRVLIICPNAADILTIDSKGKAIFSTSAHIRMFMPDERYYGQSERFLNQFLRQFSQEQTKPGYYVANHLTLKSQYIGQTWAETANFLDGKLLSIWGDTVLEKV